jgi:hypothetical protein
VAFKAAVRVTIIYIIVALDTSYLPEEPCPAPTLCPFPTVNNWKVVGGSEMIIDHIIQEAQNYEAMFNDILKVGSGPRLRQEITRDINWARKTLRKNDRIIWFLRWLKI